ncbi:MAG: hypothetical protein K1X82_08645 [Bacteroidia bacterium]|nr:hypothetical protein [Bacteroidia bacterium]
MKIEQANKIELHYFLGDNSHLIDAFVRNKCETEVLTIARDIIAALDYDITVLAEPAGDGGFKDFWKLIGKNDKQLTLIACVLTLILSRIPVSNRELERLQKENLQLDNEEKRLNIEKIKKELNSDKENSSVVQDTVLFFDGNIKVIKHKSNFYQTLNSYSNVTHISTSTYYERKEVVKPNIVDRKDFHKFILTSNDLPPLTIENAIIEIAAPVVINGKYKWKGIYEGRPIDFYMNDDEYRKSVLKGDITFHDGYYIGCLLKVKRQIDELGIIQNMGYTVQTVLGKIENGKIIETEQGKRYKKIKDELDNQTKMDF